MDEETMTLAAAIGSRVKRERQARRWTLDRLAAVAGVSRRMVVSVEQGAVNASVGTLLRLSDALGIGLPALVGLPGQGQVKITHAVDGATLWTSEAGGRGTMIAGTDGPDVLELWSWTLPRGDEHVSEAHAPGTKEVLHLQRGAMTIVVGERVVDLVSGDAISFTGDVPHAYRNAGDDAAQFTLAVFEPGVGVGTGSSDDA